MVQGGHALAEKEKEKALLELKKHYIEKYGQTDGSKVYDGEIWQGMTKEMLIDSSGKPGDIDETVYKTKTKAYYFYKSYITRQHKTRYRFNLSNKLTQCILNFFPKPDLWIILKAPINLIEKRKKELKTKELKRQMKMYIKFSKKKKKYNSFRHKLKYKKKYFIDN